MNMVNTPFEPINRWLTICQVSNLACKSSAVGIMTVLIKMGNIARLEATAACLHSCKEGQYNGPVYRSCEEVFRF